MQRRTFSRPGRASLAARPRPRRWRRTFRPRPIRIINPFSAGGGLDQLARSLGQKMSESMGQPVIVENKTGAGGNIGADFVAKSPPDGYTLVMGSSATHGINPERSTARSCRSTR